VIDKFAESLVVAERARKTGPTMRLTLVQAGIGLVLVIALEPNLSAMLATGDGGAMIDGRETGGRHASARR